MTYKEKLINLLKTVPSVKEDLEELKFWTYIRKQNWNTARISQTYLEDWYVVDNLSYCITLKDYNIIWNPLDYHHLMQYCENKKIEIHIISRTLWLFMLDKYWIADEFNAVILELDNTKSFNQQTEEVYENIVNFLTENSL